MNILLLSTIAEHTAIYFGNENAIALGTQAIFAAYISAGLLLISIKSYIGPRLRGHDYYCAP